MPQASASASATLEDALCAQTPVTLTVRHDVGRHGDVGSKGSLGGAPIDGLRVTRANASLL